MNAHRRLVSSPKLLLLGLTLALGFLACQSPPGAAAPNTLTAREKKAGWKLLFDGRTMNGWRGAYMETLPSRGWEVRDGALLVNESGGGEAAFGGDLVTIDEYGDFELLVDFKLTEGANSGIKYFVIEAEPKTPGSAKGLEYQLLDDARHPDAKLGIKGNRTCASLYDLIPAVNKPPVPVGEWNQARILVRGTHVEHWLNGVKVLEFERGGPEFLARKAESKFKDIPGFGVYPAGHILLQDHGNRVFFRNIKIRVL
jgi:3-keto-disaccharide hydrolase